MKKVFFVVAAVALLGWGAHQTFQNARVPSFQKITAEEKQGVFHAVFAVQTSTIDYIFDGDTVGLPGEERVRYIGVNAPEVSHPEHEKDLGECFGKEASERNATLVLGKEVRLVPDREDRDRYGRLLRYVWIGNISVNMELVKEGFAKTLSIPPNTSHAPEFKETERAARAAKLGLWGACI